MLKINVGFAQNYLEYYSLINQANYLPAKNQYVKSDSLFSLAFQKYRGRKHDFVSAAITSLYIGDTLKCLTLLTRAVHTGLTLEQINKNKLLSKYLSARLFERLQKIYPVYRKKYLTSLNKNDLRFYRKVELRDQLYRGKNDHGAYKKNFSEVIRLDSEDYNLVKRRILKKGWPNLGDDGDSEKSFNILTQTIAHFNPGQKNFFLSYLKQAVLNGQAYPEQYSVLFDRILLDRVEPQHYGSINIFLVDGFLRVYPINTTSIEQINIRREVIGVPAFEYCIERDGATYDPNFTFEKFKEAIGLTK